MTDGTTRQRLTRRVVLGLLGAGLLPPAGVQVADPPEADRAALVRSNAEFGPDLYEKLCSTSGNLFYSPYSISSALAMTYAGARGATADEMAKALRFSLPPARLHPTIGNLIRAINAPGTMATSMPPKFRANHPFVFFIRDKGTGDLLFAGRLANPLVS